MGYEALRYEAAGGVARITIDRPERRNALSWTVMTELRAAFAAARADSEVRVVVLTGAGDKAFCAGADLSGMAQGAGFADLHDARGELARLFREMYELGKPIIARVRGYALAGGFGLALACDLVVAADDAQFGTPEIDVGLWPFMITVPLVRSMPPKKVLELMMTGRRVGAEEAERIGFVNRVVPDGEALPAAVELAAQIAAFPWRCVVNDRRSVYEGLGLGVADALAIEDELGRDTIFAGDFQAGVDRFTQHQRERKGT
jgi:enoyl-CoA hydratase/carnithine racemase